jgi:glycosyltransferase involved in cell wall biosynthesis
MDKMPLVSIALCTYNGERFLREQLDSLLLQDYPNFEVIASDDASGDRTPQILAEYARRDARLHYQCNPRNLGFRRNFEATLRLCRGALIAICDQDDIWAADKLTLLVQALQRDSAVLAYSNSEIVDEQGRFLELRIGKEVRTGAYREPFPYIFGHLCSGHTILMRRELLGRCLPFPAGIYIYYDWWLAFVAASTGRIAYVDRCLVRYRRHCDSVTYRHGNCPRLAGFRGQELKEAEQRLELFAAFPGREQWFFQTLLPLWQRREVQLLSFGLAAFMLQYRRRLFPKDGPWRQVRLALKFVWGLRLKRWLEPHRYAPRQTG